LYFLNSAKDFDSFDRPGFLTQYGLPLQNQLSVLIDEINFKHNSTNGILNYEATNIFSPDAININAFPGDGLVSSPSMVKLGKKLFSKRLCRVIIK
jgi:cytochrome c peroxidase